MEMAKGAKKKHIQATMRAMREVVKSCQVLRGRDEDGGEVEEMRSREVRRAGQSEE